MNAPAATDAELTRACDTIIAQVTTDPKQVDPDQATACGTFTTDLAPSRPTRTRSPGPRTGRSGANVSDGQLLFEANCARCHTQGWSTFDSAVPPDQPGGVDGLGPPGGGGGTGGGIGFNLRDNDVIRRFGTDESGGFAAQVDFVSIGLDPFKAYGNGGIGIERAGCRIRQHAHEEADRRDRELRAVLPRHVDVPRGRARV